MSDNDSFKPHVMLGAGWIPVALVFHPFSGLDQKALSVPPHPDDVATGGRTEPIRLKEDYSVAYCWQNLYLDAGVYVKPNLRIRNRFSLFSADPLIFPSRDGNVSNPTEEGPYISALPPYNRQRYTSQHDAYTFVSVGKAYSDSLDLEKLIPLGKDGSLSLQLGPAVTAIQHHFGWDRYSAVQFASSSYHIYPGLHAGVGILGDITPNGLKDSGTRLADHLGNLSLTLGFSKDAPLIMLSLSLVFGGEVVF